MLDSFKFAFAGIDWSIRNHPNFRVHLIISFFVLILGVVLKVTQAEFAILVFAIILGLVAEMTNTAIEEVTNLITIKWAHQAKIAKDVSAGMMLLTAMGAVLVGLEIFVPYFL